MCHACAAQIARVVDNVTLGGNKIAQLDVIHLIANFDDVTAKFVTDDDGRLDAIGCPGVPIVNVDVRATDGCGARANQNIMRTDLRNRHLAQFKARSCVGFDHRFHHRRHGVLRDHFVNLCCEKIIAH